MSLPKLVAQHVAQHFKGVLANSGRSSWRELIFSLEGLKMFADGNVGYVGACHHAPSVASGHPARNPPLFLCSCSWMKLLKNLRGATLVGEDLFGQFARKPLLPSKCEAHGFFLTMLPRYCFLTCRQQVLREQGAALRSVHAVLHGLCLCTGNKAAGGTASSWGG